MPVAGRERALSIDCVRGLVMILMALDHTREFLTAARFAPLDLAHTTPALFLTRWVTHFCAPVFFLLAGLGISLSVARGRTVPEISHFLLTRGLWLVLLELTVVAMGWHFTLRLMPGTAGVIWALGWSMVLMAALVRLPLAVIAGVGLALMALHNLTDAISPDAFGTYAWLWRVLHVSDPYAPMLIRIDYPLVPWVGVMAVGYSMRPLVQQSPARRRRMLVLLGGLALAAFVALRLWNGYGDPQPWSDQPSRLYTALSFLRVRKYPPSLDFLLMTLGPALMTLAFLEHARGRFVTVIATFGRVPLFFYVLHIYVVHVVAVIVAYAQSGTVRFLLWQESLTPATAYPDWYGLGLPWIYAVWVLMVAALYPVCRAFAALKARRQDWWLSYV
jgi:uncharacterized membrane protein